MPDGSPYLTLPLRTERDLRCARAFAALRRAVAAARRPRYARLALVGGLGGLAFRVTELDAAPSGPARARVARIHGVFASRAAAVGYCTRAGLTLGDAA